MISTLQELIAPLSMAEFSQVLRARTLAFHRGENGKRFEGLFDWDVFYAIIKTGALRPARLRLTLKENPVAPVFYLRRDGKIDAGDLEKLIERGASLIGRRIDLCVPVLGALCAEIARLIPEEIYVGAIATTGKGGAFKLHYDPQDLFILQVEGSKRWMIYGPPVSFPVRGMTETPPLNEPLFDETLRAGDFLFLPAGYWHRCENGPGRSLHLGIFIQPPTGCDIVDVIGPWLLAEEFFRRPLTRFRDAADRQSYETEMKARLIEKISGMTLEDVMAAVEKRNAARGHLAANERSGLPSREEAS